MDTGTHNILYWKKELRYIGCSSWKILVHIHKIYLYLQKVTYFLQPFFSEKFEFKFGTKLCYSHINHCHQWMSTSQIFLLRNVQPLWLFIISVTNFNYHQLSQSRNVSIKPKNTLRTSIYISLYLLTLFIQTWMKKMLPSSTPMLQKAFTLAPTPFIISIKKTFVLWSFISLRKQILKW